MNIINTLWLAALAGAIYSPNRFHFQEPTGFGYPMGAVRFGDKYHFYFTTNRDGADPQEKGVAVVGYATSPDLVHWERQWPVLEPPFPSCIIEGGSVIEHKEERQLVMYYAQRCRTETGPSEIRRATSNDGMWWTEGEIVIAFNSKPYLTLPCVVYEPSRSRWVMTLAGAVNDDGNQPTFFHSADGINDWIEGGIFVPPAGSGAHFQPSSSTFLMPWNDDRWLMMGTDLCTDPGNKTIPMNLYFIGTIGEEDAVFKSDHSSGGQYFMRGAAFPVYGHEEHDRVVIDILDTGSLSLPWAMNTATGSHPEVDYSEFVHFSFLKAVEDLIVTPGGPPNTGFEVRPVDDVDDLVIVAPSELSEHGVYALNMTFTYGDMGGWRFVEAFPHLHGSGIGIWPWSGSEYFLSYPDHEFHVPAVEQFSPGNQREFIFLIDLEVGEVWIDGWMMHWSTIKERTPINVTVWGNGRIEDGWRLDPVAAAPASERSLEPPERPPPSESPEATTVPAESPEVTSRPLPVEPSSASALASVVSVLTLLFSYPF